MRRAFACVIVVAALAPSAACGDHSAAPDAGGSNFLQLTPCRTTPLNCGTLVVPADWSNPDGPTISLPVIDAAASVYANRIGILAFNFGGPGAPTLEPLAMNYPNEPIYSQYDLTLDFDFVMIDWRGVGDAEPALSCLDATTSAALTTETYAPQSDADWTALFALGAQISAGCTAKTANAPLLLHQDTESAARDFDALRAALGEDQLNMWDVSYGTRVGAMYATLFPDHTRAIALDSPVTPAPAFESMLIDQSNGFEAELTRYFAWCASASSADCPFQTADLQASSVAAAFEALLTAADTAPVVGHGVTLTRAALDLIATYMMYFPDVEWQPLSVALADLQHGSGDMMGDLFTANVLSENAADNELSSYQNVSLQDTPPPAAIATPATYQAWVESIAAMAPHVGLQNAAGQAFDIGWPSTAVAQTAIGNPAAPPLLITATRNDPATPYAGAPLLQQAFNNGSYLVTYEGDGHANAQFQQCLGDVTAQYLIDPTTPPATTDCANVPVGSTDAATTAAKRARPYLVGRPRPRR